MGAAAGWIVAVGLPVVHCRTTLPPVTGPRNLSCHSTTRLSASRKWLLLLQFCQQCREVYKAMFANMLSLTKCLFKLLCSVWGPNQKGPVQPVIAAFAPTPPMQCNAAKHGSPLLLASQCLVGFKRFPWVKSRGSAVLQYGRPPDTEKAVQLQFLNLSHI